VVKNSILTRYFFVYLGGLFCWESLDVIQSSMSVLVVVGRPATIATGKPSSRTSFLRVFREKPVNLVIIFQVVSIYGLTAFFPVNCS
jgi:hypothetical protein